MKPLVSIVIPTYNRACDLERALKSVLAQTYSYWEALIVDNNSSDNTNDVVKSFNDSRMKLFKIHNNGVIAASRNLGIQHSQGEYIGFLDSDDWWMPQKLAESLKYLEQGADVVYHDLFLAIKSDQRLFWRKTYTRDLRSPIFNDLLVNGNALNNSSIVVRKELLIAIKGLAEDRSLIAAEDYDTWLRAAKSTEKFKRIPKTLGYYWAGGGNISNPDRLLKIYDAIEERYATEFRNLNEHSCFCWIDYAKGRAHYRLGSYAMAKKNLELVLMRRAPPSIYIKSHWMLLLINLYLHSKIRF